MVDPGYKSVDPIDSSNTWHFAVYDMANLVDAVEPADSADIVETDRSGRCSKFCGARVSERSGRSDGSGRCDGFCRFGVFGRPGVSDEPDSRFGEYAALVRGAFCARSTLSTIEVHPTFSGAPYLRNSIPNPKTDFRKN